MARRLRRPTALLAVSVLLAGCYAHVPVSLERVKPPARVRAQISPEAGERIAPVLGEARTTLMGRLVEITPQGIYLDVTSGYVEAGMRSERLTQRLLLEREEVLGLQRRELDRTRTMLAVGAGAAAVAAMVYVALSGETGGTTGGPGPGPVEAGVPLLRVPLR